MPRLRARSSPKCNKVSPVSAKSRHIAVHARAFKRMGLIVQSLHGVSSDELHLWRVLVLAVPFTLAAPA